MLSLNLNLVSRPQLESTLYQTLICEKRITGRFLFSIWNQPLVFLSLLRHSTEVGAEGKEGSGISGGAALLQVLTGHAAGVLSLCVTVNGVWSVGLSKTGSDCLVDTL